MQKLTLDIGEGRGGGGPGGQAPSIIWEGGPTYPLINSPLAFSFNFYVKREKITNVPS